MKRFCARVAAAMFALCACAAAAWAEPGGYGRPIDVSLDGHRSDFLFDLVTIFIGILFLIMVVVIFWASIAHRERKGHKALYDHGVSKKHLVFTAALAGAIFFGVDGTALVHSADDIANGFFKFPDKDPNALDIEVYGQQWAWNFRYAGPDGKFNTPDDVITLNEMHVPLDRPVYLKIKSKDVIHSFYLPNFRVKQDAMPGSITRLWFEAKKPGHFEIGCAQHCGANHYKMRGWITIESQQDYDQWLKDEAVSAQRRYDEADSDAHWGWDWES